MQRRQFITLLSGVATAASVPLTARAQSGRPRRVGVLVSGDDPQNATQLNAFTAALAQLGWVENENTQFDIRRGMTDASRIRAGAGDLVRARPDVIVVGSLSQLVETAHATKTIPIVFVNAVDPVGAGLVPSLARHDSNVTGFTSVEPSTSGKWLEVLKEVNPRLSAALAMFNSETPAFKLRLPAIEAAAQALKVRLTTADVRSDADIVRAIDALAAEPDGGLIALPGPIIRDRRDVIIGRVARHRMAAVYPDRGYVDIGGLMSYSADLLDQYRSAARYVDRILRGARTGDLPIQQPTKFELIINLKTAKAQGLDIPWFLQQRADELIE
jgi:ABC-type uncharacterized transport system substrate-binding protein